MAPRRRTGAARHGAQLAGADRDVVAFCVANRADGGNGALIVLLRPALD
jgi:DNA-nicking Smr family endonuclease